MPDTPAGDALAAALVAEIEAYGRDCIFHGLLVDHSGVVSAAQRIEVAARAEGAAERNEKWLWALEGAPRDVVSRILGRMCAADPMSLSELRSPSSGTEAQR